MFEQASIAANSAPAATSLSVGRNNERPTSIRNNNTPACLTEDLLDQFAKAFRNSDGPGMRYLANNGCFLMKQDAAITVLRRGIIASQIRVYVSEHDALDLFAYGEVLEK